MSRSQGTFAGLGKRRIERVLLGGVCLASSCTPHVEGSVSRDAAPESRDAGLDASRATPAPPAPHVAPSSAASATAPSESSFDPDAACARFASVPIPAEDEPSLAEAAALARCDSEALYYGIGNARDFREARRCAYAERRSRSSPVIGGSGVLMMIYANAKRVRRNVDLASKFACEMRSSEVELEARLDQLESWRTIRESRDLDVCDHITSGFMDGFCTAHRERTAAVARNERKVIVRRGLPEPELARLEHAAKAYFDARADNEVDLSGSSRAAMRIAEHAALEDTFVDALERSRTRAFPPADDPAAAELELTRAFETIMQCKAQSPFGGFAGTVRREDVRTTQRLWLAYREAWVALAAKMRPDAAPGAFRGWLARERTRALSAFANECSRSPQ